MKFKRKILTILLSILISIQIFSNINLNINAAGGFYTSDSFSLTANAFTPDNGLSYFSAYTMQDDSGLLSGFQYYMKIEDGKAISCDGGQVITNILNYKIGVSMSIQALTTFIASYTGSTVFTGQDPNYYNNCKPVLKNGNLVGIALNDLTGCRMAYSENSDSVSIPSTEVNNVYNYFIYYQEQNPIVPDFINIPTFSQTYCKSNWTTNNQALYKGSLDNTTKLPKFLISTYEYEQGACSWVFNNTKNELAYYEEISDPIYVASTGYNSICTAFELNDSKNQISFDEFIISTTDFSLDCYCYDNLGSQQKLYYWNGNQYVESANKYTTFITRYRHCAPYTINGDYLTIYKNLNIKNQIELNTYQKTFYVSTKYTTYNTTNDNGYNSNVQNINNSTSNNTTIYNETKTENNTNIKENNYNYDNSQNNSNNTTIINNYYGNNGDDSGGGSDDDDDDTIWKALLKAIAGFFEKIGELIATLLTGIFSIFTSILDAITSITEDFSSITSFISSFFSWLPAPITSLIVLGLGLALICAFLSWFKK